MIDIHTHVLPGIDDGSESIETSIEQLKLMQDAGVTDVVCTSHFLLNNWHNTNDILTEKFQLLQNAITKNELQIKIHQAAEVYLDEKSPQLIKQEKFNIDETNYVLVETAMPQFPADIYEILFQLVRDGYKPILAHPERYQTIINNIELAEDLLHKNIYFQINAGSILGMYGAKVKKTAWNLLNGGFAHFLASDNHCRSDDYILPIAYDLVAQKFDDYTANLLTKVNPAKMLNNEKIEYFYLESIEIEQKSFLKKIKKKLAELL